jgi:hypothetical protein
LPKLEQKEIKIPSFPKQKDFPNVMSFKEAKDIIEALQGVRDDLGQVYKVIDEKEFGEGGNGQPTIISHGSTVTNVNLNGMRGIVETTAVTVGTTATQLPTANLVNRRSLVIFNNSSYTIYIGGEDVTTADGLPVPTQSYSPSLDAGMNMDLYAISASAGCNVRVLEASSEKEGA